MIDIDEARRRLEAMTIGPWHDGGSNPFMIHDIKDPRGLRVGMVESTDIDAIVYMRNHFAELLKEVERLRAAVHPVCPYCGSQETSSANRLARCGACDEMWCPG